MGFMKGSSCGGREIVEVEGGHIVRSTGRKDRHSKVYTSKGPRDRRVRLAAHTAIQFYDVQDRLGFDRPSKAVDWLIEKAKSSIDKLIDLPPWNPTITSVGGTAAASTSTSAEIPMPEQPGVAEGYTAAGSPFMPPQPQQLGDSDSMKLFFPTSNVVAPPQSVTFTDCYIPPEMVAGAAQQREYLGLSLHPFQDSSGGLHSSSNRAPFIGVTTGAFEQLEGCRNYPRMVWGGGDPGTEENRGGLGQGFLMSQGGGSTLMMANPQRGPLQSSFLGSFGELTTGASLPPANDSHKPPVVAVHQPSFFGSGLVWKI
ncbi:hypothetical protein SAY87_030707 [Trapa incisa]|uniref:TCP domain-containing protein n=1 Tax=Trapa incisa TaxID=236973 RepID=A0AAN7KNX1_9MYRT|nr:hypothetical protein SAY87_030707 [Trapa incisa]